MVLFQLRKIPFFGGAKILKFAGLPTEVLKFFILKLE